MKTQTPQFGDGIHGMFTGMLDELMERKRWTRAATAEKLGVSVDVLAYMLDAGDSRGEPGPGKHAVNPAWEEVRKRYHRMTLKFVLRPTKRGSDGRFCPDEAVYDFHARTLMGIERKFAFLGTPDCKHSIATLFERLATVSAMTTQDAEYSARMGMNGAFTGFYIADQITKAMPRIKIDAHDISVIKWYVNGTLLPQIKSLEDRASKISQETAKDDPEEIQRRLKLTHRAIGYAYAALAHLGLIIESDDLVQAGLNGVESAAALDPDQVPVPNNKSQDLAGHVSNIMWLSDAVLRLRHSLGAASIERVIAVGRNQSKAFRFYKNLWSKQGMLKSLMAKLKKNRSTLLVLLAAGVVIASAALLPHVHMAGASMMLADVVGTRF